MGGESCTVLRLRLMRKLAMSLKQLDLKINYIIGKKNFFTPSMSTKYISKPEQKLRRKQIKNHPPSKLS